MRLVTVVLNDPDESVIDPFTTGDLVEVTGSRDASDPANPDTATDSTQRLRVLANNQPNPCA